MIVVATVVTVLFCLVVALWLTLYRRNVHPGKGGLTVPTREHPDQAPSRPEQGLPPG